MVVITGVSIFKNKWLDVVTLDNIKIMIIKLTILTTKEKYIIVERGGSKDSGEISHGFKTPLSIHIL